MPRKLPVFLLEDEVDRLLNASDTQRDRLILMLMTFMGLRCSEVCKLQIDHLDFRRRLLWVRAGKGSKDRALPIPKFLQGPLRGWVGGKKGQYVFPSPRGGQLTNRAIQKIVKRTAVKAKLPRATDKRRYHPHALRHVCASKFLEQGMTIYELMVYLGHENISTTERYLFSTPNKLMEAVDRAYGD